MKNFLSLFVIVAFCTSNVQAQQVNQMSIDDCVAYALEHKTTLKSLKFEETLQQLKNSEIATATKPQVGFSASASGFVIVPKQRSAADAFGNLFGSIYAPIKPEAIDQAILQEIAAASAGKKYNELQFALPYNISCTLSATQILFEPSLFVALEARHGIEELTRINTERSAIQARYDITKAYYQVLVAQKRVALFDDNIALINSFYDMTSKLYKEGFAEKIDADRLQVQRNNLTIEKNKVENLIALSYQLLKFQMGMPLTEGIMLTDTLDISTIKRDALGAELNYDNRIEMRQLHQAESLQLLDMKRYQKSYLPTVVAFGNAGLGSSTKSFGDLFTYSYFPQMLVGVSVSMPVYNGGKRNLQVQQATVSLQKLRNDMETVKQGISLEHTNAKTQLTNSLIALDNQESNIELAKKVYTVAQKKYKEGLGSSIEVMQAQTALKDAQTNYLGATYDVINAYVDFLKALGELN
jgi:outer membrane protein